MAGENRCRPSLYRLLRWERLYPGMWTTSKFKFVYFSLIHSSIHIHSKQEQNGISRCEHVIKNIKNKNTR